VQTQLLGKRETRKRQTRQALLATAKRLFFENGYDNTKMEHIAEAAGIAVGTCYNYFERKADLLIALVVDADRACIAAAEPLFENLPDDPKAAIASIALHGTRHTFHALDKSGWRRVMASIHENPESPFARLYSDTTDELDALMVRCLSVLQRRGHLRSDLPAETLAAPLFSLKYMLFVGNITDETATLDAQEAKLIAAIDVLVDGLSPPPPS